jgi:hypothetical protein
MKVFCHIKHKRLRVWDYLWFNDKYLKKGKWIFSSHSFVRTFRSQKMNLSFKEFPNSLLLFDSISSFDIITGTGKKMCISIKLKWDFKNFIEKFYYSSITIKSKYTLFIRAQLSYTLTIPTLPQVKTWGFQFEDFVKHLRCSLRATISQKYGILITYYKGIQCSLIYSRLIRIQFFKYKVEIKIE